MVAADSCQFDYEGQRVTVIKGRTTAREGHPIVAAFEGLFVPLVPDFEVTGPEPKTAARTASAKKST